MPEDIKYTIIIPSAGGEKLITCLDSIDEEIRENVIVYQNAPGIDVPVTLAGSGVNDGVSRAWNFGRQHVIDNEQDYLIILSQNVVLHDGMRDYIRELNDRKPRHGAWSNLSWHLTAISRETLESAGEFDTNFYPIYYEDSEYAIRLFKLGIFDEIYSIPVAGECPSGYSTTLGMRPDVEPLKQYMLQKWGEIFDWTRYHDQNFYDHPFNNPDNDIGYFEHKTTEELIKHYGYDQRVYDLYIKPVRGMM